MSGLKLSSKTAIAAKAPEPEISREIIYFSFTTMVPKCIFCLKEKGKTEQCAPRHKNWIFKNANLHFATDHLNVPCSEHHHLLQLVFPSPVQPPKSKIAA